MTGKGCHAIEKKDEVFFGIFKSELPKWNPQTVFFRPCGVFASIGQVGVGFDVSSSSPTSSSRNNELKISCNDVTLNSIPSEVGPRIVDILPKTDEDELLENLIVKKNEGFKLKFKVSNPSVRRLISGAFAGVVSRTAVAPLETIRTHLMVGNSGHSSGEVFNTIMKTDGWKGLFRGNFVNVVRVAPSKAIELFAYDTVKKMLTPKPEEPLKIPVPPSLVAGAFAGISSTLCTYPLELLKTRITIQKDVYNNLLDAFVKIVRDEGPGELYRGLTPSLIGVVPYAATNYFAYDSLRKAYKKTFKKDPGNIATLFIGSMAGAISSSTTFPLEVARKQMQVGAVGGRRVYTNMLHALISIVEKEGVEGLYKGLGPSCMKLVPAAGIAFMCYEGCKNLLVEDEELEKKDIN